VLGQQPDPAVRDNRLVPCGVRAFGRFADFQRLVDRDHPPADTEARAPSSACKRRDPKPAPEVHADSFSTL
jgi:hypothetical protein